MQPVKLPTTVAIGIVAIAVVIAVLPMFLVVVDTGEVGVVSLFGRVSDNYLEEGLQLKNPFSKVTTISVRTQDYTMSAAAGEGRVYGDDSIEVIGIDGAKLSVDMTVWYHVDRNSATKLYKEVGIDFDEKIVRPTIRSAVREVFTQYKVNEAYATKRDEITQKIKERIVKTVEDRGIVLEDALMRDVKLSAALTASIEQKLAAQQESEKFEYLLEKEKKEAERKVIEARGQRDAQKIVAEGLTAKYLQYLYITSLENRAGTVYVPTEGGIPLFKAAN